MYFEEALRAELDTIEELTNKVFPLTAPEGTEAPYIIYVSSEGIQDKSLQGYLSSKEVPCEINILVDDYLSLKELTTTVLAKILSFQGHKIGDFFIQDVSYEKPVEIYEQEVDLYRSVIDFTFYF